MLVPVIMAGGSGTRLWPLSRALYPKQFLPLLGENTMLQTTIDRLNTLDVTAPVTICNEDHRFIVAEQLRSINKMGSIILEPQGRNTAPAIALAANIAMQTNKDTDPLLLILAADHVIQDEAAFTAR
jgi:mannose-1-phosphate guanylyltransferase